MLLNRSIIFKLEFLYLRIKFLDVGVSAGSEWSFNSEKDSTLFIYILQGEGSFDPDKKELISEKHAVLFNEGDIFWVKASNRGIRFYSY